MEIKTLVGVDNKVILNAFNDSFSDYFVPLKLTKKQLISKMLADKTDLNLSVGVFEKKKLIAFILHGFDIINNEKIVYNGGTGVIPEKRGFGLTKQMYLFILPILIEKRINKLILEVITKNTQAIKSYKKSGFKMRRELFCYKGEIEPLKTNNYLKIKKLERYNWKLMESFWDIYPTWQNSRKAIGKSNHNNISLGAYIEDKLVGYIVHNPANRRVQQIAVSKNFRKERIASTLFLKLKETYGNYFSIINVDKSSKGVNDFFKKIGLENNLEQLEMELDLNKNYS
ncbi:GNAT family N-acetyltransferase [Tenacibaculum sp. SDUM215027]|uniref:GNAT family N-acetyltransferase n=1 Tax=Tenacibaculum sp. SDUM215027 TaxID=3422596 RepID=UPI003D323219